MFIWFIIYLHFSVALSKVNNNDCFMSSYDIYLKRLQNIYFENKIRIYLVLGVKCTIIK